MDKKKNRVLGLDLVRCLAIFSVISVHFFLNNEFYNTDIKGFSMFISSFIRWAFFICVPLFLLLTGYLNKNKTPSRDYYKGIIKIISSYLFISIICLLFRKFYLNETIGHIRGIVSIFNFKADKYAWYVEMYIGLFLLIPFLNIIYNNLKNKKEKQYLLLTMLVLTSISPIINFIKIRGITIDIVPNWWYSLYPITYYFIGCYISEFKIKFNKLKSILSIIILILIETIITYIGSNHGIKIFSGTFDAYGNLITVVISVLVFVSLYQVDVKNKIVRKSISLISLLSFDMYLFSFIADSIVYKYALKYLDNCNECLKYYIVIVLAVFIISFILAYIKKILFDLIKKITH